MLKEAASAPVKAYVTVPPATSVALAVYTTVAVLVPSATLTVVAELMVGATSVTVRVTAWVLNAPDGSEAFTLKLYEDLVSKSGVETNVTAPVELLIVNDAASAPVRA